jgi:hypothetical protein
MKNILAGHKTSIKGACTLLGSLSLSILAILLVQEVIANYLWNLTAERYIHLYPFKNLPVINVLFWLPQAFIFLLLTIMVIDKVQIIRAFSRALKVIGEYWLQLLVWLLAFIVFDALLYIIFITVYVYVLTTYTVPSSALNFDYNSVAIIGPIITRSALRFALGLTFMVQIYNFYRKQSL